ncbi:MAG: hypothetical protein ACR5KV_02525 [Wolbachia sp.]
MSLFIKIAKVKSIVEIGTLYGYSLICMAKLYLNMAIYIQ